MISYLQNYESERWGTQSLNRYMKIISNDKFINRRVELPPMQARRIKTHGADLRNKISGSRALNMAIQRAKYVSRQSRKVNVIFDKKLQA